MSDQTPAQTAEAAAPSPAAAPATKTQTTIPEMESCELITATHVPGGHAFVVTTVETERTVITTTTTETRTSEEKEVSGDCLKAVPIMTPAKLQQPEDGPSCSSRSRPLSDSKSVVPLSSSLPSKLLRFHAKRSAQALLHQVGQSQSLDSQFGSDESGAAGGAGSGYSSESTAHECEMPRPTAPSLTPRSTPVEGYDDVGMGSSIEDSEESEEDDELKPLAVDNHMFHDVDLGSPRAHQNSPQDEMDAAATSAAAVLSEANLEKFHKHQANPYHMDNIYLHPNFKYQLEQKESPEVSPPPPVAPASSPTTEQKRVHRSFLTMKKSISVEAQAVETAGSVCSNKAETNSDMGVVNEIDSLEAELVPSEEMAQEIADAVEFYFSNESILKDAFLLKHVRRNKEGFVSLKLVSSFKRVRQLTKEWKVVGNAVRRKSRKIELNDVGTKVRRIDPLPSFDETMPSRTIVACDLPMDKLTIEKVSDIFSKCGEIALIRILKPGMAIPVDVRQFMNKYPEMQQKECALVEYLESSSAREAKDLEGPFQVFDMVAPKKKTGKKAIIQIAAPVQRMVENYRYYNDATYERTRGGSFSGVMPHSPPEDLRYRLKRNNSEIPVKSVMDFNASHHHQPSYHQYHQTAHHHHQHHHHQPHTHYTQQPAMHRGSFAADHPYHHYQARNSISHEAVAGSPVSSPSLGPGGQPNFFAYSPRRYSNTSTISANTAAAQTDSPSGSATVAATFGSPSGGSGLQRRLSNSSDHNYSFGGNNNNNTTNSSTNLEMSRRSSNCSDSAPPQRRDSNCSDNCPCSRRISDYGQTESYRKTSHGSIGSLERRFSNGSIQFERTMSNASDVSIPNTNMFPRRMSNDFNYDRKQSIETQTQTDLPYDNDGNVGGGGGGWNVFPRRYSNNFTASSKMAAYDNAQYINGRRISTDSGYDRRCSFGSEYEGSPRSRTGSFLNNYKHASFDLDGQPRSRTGSFLDGSPRSRSGSFAQRTAEALVRTPIGPDGSKGFGSRTRKFGQTVSPV